jgi:hypothetical protein
MEFVVKLGRMRFSMRLSRILAKKDNRLIGRKEEIEPGGLLGLWTRIIVEYFQSIGK